MRVTPERYVHKYDELNRIKIEANRTCAQGVRAGPGASVAAQEEETPLTEVLDSAVAVLEAAVYKKTLRDATYLGGQADYRALVRSVCAKQRKLAVI